MSTPKTKAECDKLIKELTELKSKLPDHPEIANGQLYLHKTEGLCIAHKEQSGYYKLIFLDGICWSHGTTPFEGSQNEFTYLGMASELLSLNRKKKQTKSLLTDEIIRRAARVYENCDDSREGSIRAAVEYVIDSLKL